MINRNDSLSNIKRFYYLKCALKGEASRVLKSLEMSEDNYAAAWEQLHNRYENKDKRIDHYIEGMFRLPAMKSYSASALRQLVDNFSNHR